MNKFLLPLILSITLLSAEEDYKGMAINIPNWVQQSEHIVEVCYFKMVYLAPNGKNWKAESTWSGVITKVIKGNLKVGTRIDNTFLNDSPGKEPNSTKIIEGEIKIVFLEQDEVLPDKQGLIQTLGWHPRFDRVSPNETDKECRRALKIELSKKPSSSK